MCCYRKRPRGTPTGTGPDRLALSVWPLARPADWLDFVNEPQSDEEFAALRRSVNRRCPFGDDEWQEQVVKELGLESTTRDPGRLRKEDS